MGLYEQVPPTRIEPSFPSLPFSIDSTLFRVNLTSNETAISDGFGVAYPFISVWGSLSIRYNAAWSAASSRAFGVTARMIAAAS